MSSCLFGASIAWRQYSREEASRHGGVATSVRNEEGMLAAVPETIVMRLLNEISISKYGANVAPPWACGDIEIRERKYRCRFHLATSNYEHLQTVRALARRARKSYLRKKRCAISSAWRDRPVREIVAGGMLDPKQ